MKRKKINRYLRFWRAELRQWTFRQKSAHIPALMLRGIERKRRARPRYTAYQFASAHILTKDGQKVPLRGHLTIQSPIEETQEVRVSLPTSFSVTLALPPAASHLFARPDSDPRMN